MKIQSFKCIVQIQQKFLHVYHLKKNLYNIFFASFNNMIIKDK